MEQSRALFPIAASEREGGIQGWKEEVRPLQLQLRVIYRVSGYRRRIHTVSPLACTGNLSSAVASHSTVVRIADSRRNRSSPIRLSGVLSAHPALFSRVCVEWPRIPGDKGSQPNRLATGSGSSARPQSPQLPWLEATRRIRAKSSGLETACCNLIRPTGFGGDESLPYHAAAPI